MGQSVRSSAVLAPITLPPVHQCSFCFCSSSTSTLISCVFIRLVRVLGILIRQAHLIRQLWQLPDLKSFSSSSAVGSIISRPHWLSVSECAALTWASDLSCQNFAPYSLFSSFPILQFVLLDWLTMCLVSPESLSFQFGALFASNSISDLLPTLTGNFFCTCSALRKPSLHYYHWMLCTHNGTLLIIILSDGSCNASSCNNYCDCCVHYADYCYFKRGRILTLAHRTLTHDLDVENEQTCQQEDYFAAYFVGNVSHSLYFLCQNSEAFQAQVLCRWPYRRRQRRCVKVCI